MDFKHEIKLHSFGAALQSIITREGGLLVKTPRQIAEEAMKYAEASTDVWFANLASTKDKNDEPA
jgi:hypothetical protein